MSLLVKMHTLIHAHAPTHDSMTLFCSALLRMTFELSNQFWTGCVFVYDVRQKYNLHSLYFCSEYFPIRRSLTFQVIELNDVQMSSSKNHE